MPLAIVLGFVAGFFLGNGIPYYIGGSTGSGVSPSPFPQTPTVNVAVGWIALVIGAVAWSFAGADAHPLPAYAAGAAGFLVVGLIHARSWGSDPWHRRSAAVVEES